MGPIHRFFAMLSLPDATIFYSNSDNRDEQHQTFKFIDHSVGHFFLCQITATQNGNYIFSWTKLITGREAIGSLPPWFLQEVPDQREGAGTTRPFLSAWVGGGGGGGWQDWHTNIEGGFREGDYRHSTKWNANRPLTGIHTAVFRMVITIRISRGGGGRMVITIRKLAERMGVTIRILGKGC
jgi:hypothetical protein